MIGENMKNEYWAIDVAHWGTLFCYGSEQEAEDWRKHKARWEQCVARKRLATKEEIRVIEFKDLKDLIL